MQAYLGNQDVTLTIPLVTASGEVIDATAVQYRVIDQDEVELVAKVALATFAPGDAEVTITVDAAQNDLGLATRAVRSVELYVEGTGGTTLLTAEYVIEVASVLAVGVNSFQTFPNAVMIGFELPNLPGWNAASRQERMNALMAAYRNFGKLALRYVTEDTDPMTRVIQPVEWNYNDITKMPQNVLLQLPSEYLAALRRAQVYEADFLLGGDEVGDIRRSGLMSATIGESSQFFRPAKPYEAAVCKRALKEVSRYLISSVRVGRA